ncbi:MAG TPA: hypothetical protein VHF26_17620 [Trebonia sp.]|nr:hypothetical protein [Trebonia sp.]
MQYSRDEVVRMLRKTGFPEVADKALAELPDPVDLNRLEEWGMRHGVTRDILVSQLGGSP